MATIKVPQVFQLYTGGSAVLPLDGSTLAEALRNLAVSYPQLAPHLMNRAGALHHYVHIFRDGVELPRADQGEVAISSGDEIILVPGIAGG
jgi:molybdopterin converting factor small subunit